MKNKNYYKKLRNKYLPKKIKVIFILESPPKSGLYFYNSTGNTNEVLFREMMRGTNINCFIKEEGLQKFAKKGYFLIDATYQPVNNLSKRERNKIILNEYHNLIEDLKIIIKNEKIRIILVKANICKLLEGRLLDDEFNVVNNGTIIPFPAYGWQQEFVKKIRKFL